MRLSMRYLAVQPAETPRFDSKNRMPKLLEISRYCSSLVFLTTRAADQGDVLEMQLAHFSVKEYFLSNSLELLKPKISA